MSNPRVTITLGRSGQVVEREGASGSAQTRGDRGGLVSGGKRSMRDRLGSNNAHGGKRQRGDGIKWRGGDNGSHDSRISQNDLRLKLLRKRSLTSFKQSGRAAAERRQMAMRPKLSKPAHSAVKYQMSQHEMENSSFRREMPPRSPRESGAESYYRGSQRNFNSSQNREGFRARGSQRNFNSSQNREGFRARSPDSFQNTSFEPSPQRHYSELQSASSFRPFGTPRNDHFRRNGMVGSSQPADSFTFRSKSNPQTAKPVGQVLPTNYGMQKDSYMGKEPTSVASLMHNLGLGKYAIIFQAEEVDMSALKQMTDKDLKELGIPMGPRKKILLALLPRGKRPPPP